MSEAERSRHARAHPFAPTLRIRHHAFAMVTKWDLIYELRADEEHVRQLQAASANGHGFSATPYLFGSKEWWVAIDSGSIERRAVEGTITGARPTSMPNRQEFRMLTPDGSELTGVRHGDPTRYLEGLHVRFEYVTLQRSAAVFSEPRTTADVVIAVWIEHSHRRTPYLHSVLPPFPWPIDFGS
jgi:hypothetical protein